MVKAGAANGRFRIVSEHPAPRFLGLPVDERNARVVRRSAARAGLIGEEPARFDADDGDGSGAPTLRVPAGVAITRALVDALPAPTVTWELVWDGANRPIVWSGPAPSTGRKRIDVPDGAALDVSSAAARRRSAWRLLRESG